MAMTPPQRGLGDLLLQLVLHARSPARRSLRSGGDCRGISAKLIRRHSHVVSQAHVRPTPPPCAQREAIKADEWPAPGSSHASATASPLSDRLASKVRGQTRPGCAMDHLQKAASARRVDYLGGVWRKLPGGELGRGLRSRGSGDRAHAQRRTRRMCCHPAAERGPLVRADPKPA